jgi:hypothetical protein
MNVVIPPLLFYAVGIVLVLAGVARAFLLGRRDSSREIADDDPARARTRRRHLTFGLVWIAMGLFLIASTAGVLRSRASTSNVAVPPAAGEGAPRIRLDPARPTGVGPSKTP